MNQTANYIKDTVLQKGIPINHDMYFESDHIENETSDKELRRLQKDHKDIIWPLFYNKFRKDIEDAYKENNLERLIGQSDQSRIDFDHKIPGMNFLIRDFGTKGKRYEASGLFHYPPKGFCGWHTNSDLPGERVYLIWNEEDNKSFFKYENKEGDIITIKEKKGWQINKFEVPSWHCVGSYTNRVSIGFRELKGGK